MFTVRNLDNGHACRLVFYCALDTGGSTGGHLLEIGGVKQSSGTR